MRNSISTKLSLFKITLLRKGAVHFNYFKKIYRFNYAPEPRFGYHFSDLDYGGSYPGFSKDAYWFVFNFFLRRFFITFRGTPGYFTFYGGMLYCISSSLFFSSAISFCLNVLLGLGKKFKSKLYLVGLRVRVDKIFKRAVIFKLNLSHKVKWRCSQIRFFKFRKIKNAFGLKTRSSYLHKIFLYVVRKFKLPDVYKGNGIRFYKEKLKFKKRKQFGAF